MSTPNLTRAKLFEARVRTLYRQAHAALPFSTAIATFLSAIIAQGVEPRVVGAWWLALISINLIRLATLRRFEQRATSLNIGTWYGYFLGQLTLLALLWGGGQRTLHRSTLGE